tara:strand:+ start:8582 stop:9625 length:1044 start_codon:yes stop_codon:yes gene_type:complete
MKNILVTGGCGFIGSNFVKHLISKKNYYPIIIDKLTYAGNLDNLSQISKKCFEFIEGDICDEKLVYNLFKKYNLEGVFHLAAESHVDRSIDGPMVFIDTNIIGTFNLLQASRAHIKRNKHNFKFIHISTDEVYGDLGRDGYFDENSSYKPNSPYSASKAASDHLVRAWGRTFHLPVIITNCSNNYGANQFPEKLIPLMIINCLDWKKLPIYGNGKNIRDWLYVEDHCIALETIFSKGDVGETYNIGGSNEIKNIDIVKIICDIMDELKPSKNGSYADLITFVDDRPGHDKRYAVDSTKLQNTLKWKPRESFQSGIKKTIEWYLNNEDWWRKIQKNNYNQQRLGLKNK